MKWIYLILGLWIAASPWLVDSFGLTLKWTSLTAGSIVAIIALWELFGRK